MSVRHRGLVSGTLICNSPQPIELCAPGSQQLETSKPGWFVAEAERSLCWMMLSSEAVKTPDSLRLCTTGLLRTAINSSHGSIRAESEYDLQSNPSQAHVSRGKYLMVERPLSLRPCLPQSHNDEHEPWSDLPRKYLYQ